MNPADAEYESRIVDPQIRRFVEYLRGKRGEGHTPPAQRSIRSISAMCWAMW